MMPRPRFEKLTDEKRELILEATAKEFAANGYAQASLNRILENAGISKGAAYYYFDDKADLYMTAVQHYSSQVLESINLEPETLTAETFWETMAEVYRQQFSEYQERPWVLGLTKSGAPFTGTELLSGPLAEFWQEMQMTLVYFLQTGQALGVVRTDLEMELLVALLVAVDDTHDRWLFAGETAVAAAEAANRIVDLLQRLFAPT
jgi:AcrR family transcriptional regulator